MDRKKELKLQYQQMKPAMGIFLICSRISNKCFLEATPDLKGRINSTRFKLESGAHPNRELQREWHDYGAGNFSIEILEHLAYAREEAKTDYTEDLALLQMIWEEKLARENKVFYKK